MLFAELRNLPAHRQKLSVTEPACMEIFKVDLSLAQAGDSRTGTNLNRGAPDSYGQLSGGRARGRG